MSKGMIATFNVESGKIMASDPCYSIDVWCQGDVPARNGKYYVYITRKTEKGFEHWGERNWEMEIVHEDFAHLRYDGSDWEMVDGTFGVDSGTFGFFDYDYYAKYHTEKTQRNWYDRNVCNIDGNWNADIDGKGVWCESGYGDGLYGVYAVYEGDEVVALKVTFIYEDEDEDEI
jgi:hypothetical protein